MSAPVFDVIIVGGGIAGSTLGGVLARAGLGVVVVEKEARFRDRIRGEGTWPWGVAEAHRAGLECLLDMAGTVEVRAFKRFESGQPVETVWERPAPEDIPGMGFLHPRFQEAAFGWAEAQGATTIRPAKATRFSRNGRPSLSVTVDGGESELSARLIVGADGKLSMTRRWTGGECVADPENHRMGGVLISGAVYEREWDNFSWDSCEAVNWFGAGPEMTRLYLVMTAQRLRETGVDRSFAALVDFAARHTPEGALENVEQQGPIGFFPNNDIWASRIAGNDVVLIGDAAGAPDPTQGHGTALLFHDVRALSELLLAEPNWNTAIEEFAERRRRAFAVIREVDCWNNVFFDMSEEAARLREGHQRALQHDPSLGGFSSIDANGPAGLVADEAARRRFFGEDLS
ncbi:MAG: Salicylate hydroxylase [Thermomicrobiales bacterium]|jgi:2-polyprenyl-6-methoxyphenol hydroxylase-like FAD-dependent oxidoreductase|nr:Salicylate hydroxylase [Thermomicrobiales bacterium]